MLDFLMISTRSTKRGLVEIYPKFIIKKSKDLMIRGQDFYAIFDNDTNYWSTDEQDAIRLIDNELDKYYLEHKDKFEDQVKVLHMWDAETGIIDIWHKYCQRQSRDNYQQLNTKLLFNNQNITREDYATRKLDYNLEEGPIDNWNSIISGLYSDEERFKIEWAIGSIVSGDSKKLEKFLVLYGKPGTGKGTILKIIEKLFSGYTAVFDAKSLGSSTSEFALEAFKSNPLVAIQYDGDLSHIENNARLNSLISHEKMTVNEKHKSLYAQSFNSFLLLGTNSPVKITDNKSGIIRRLIDVSPLGNKLSKEKYFNLMEGIDFELGHIAYHCLQIYNNNKDAFDAYRPTMMMSESNDFYNFVLDSYIIFDEENGTTLKSAWEMYKTYCEEAKVAYPLNLRAFKSEMRTYFDEYDERKLVNGMYVRSYFSGFKRSNFNKEPEDNKIKIKNESWLDFKEQKSNLDLYCKDCPAQYGTAKETPQKKWTEVTTTLSDLNTSKLHYLKVPNNLIVIDFDIRDEEGNKSYELNLKEASKWPKTYAELSKSGGGIHLHYIYNGDVTKLSSIYGNNIEIKVFSGNSSLRRKLTKCTNDNINTINSGLPLKKGGGKVINFDAITNEKGLRTIIKKNLNKEYHPATKPSCDFIFKVLEDAYNSGMHYDVRDMHNVIFAFAASSTNQSDYCMDLVTKMHFCSDDIIESKDTTTNDKNKIVFYDVEVFPNLLLINWKFEGEGQIVNRMINPTPVEIEELTKWKLVGYNCRRYDNHILYGRLIGYNNQQIYELSHKIISDHDGFFGNAYNLSYTDIYDYASKKQTLKKWEIELGIHHQELGFDWDKDVPEDKWEEVAAYCDNDVISTEAVWNATKDDFLAREILAEIAGMSVNDTTNSITTRIIFGKEKTPELVYTNLEEQFHGYEFIKKWNQETHKYETHNMYRGIDLGFGGYVYAEPGMYGNVALLDVASLHPHSLIAMNCFGNYTKKFKDLVDIRILVKHKKFDEAKKLFDGKLAKYFEDANSAKNLSKALKVAINSVYGLTSATFSNPFRDPRNENNIVALRGALFMKTLQDEVVKRGFTVAHIKTDSIKIPDATPEIIDFCMKFAKDFGYTFEHEATYDKICLVNDAVYIAKYASLDKCNKLYGEDYINSSADTCAENKEHGGQWTATGTQFQVPYVFKKCFSREPIIFDDLCEVKEVKNTAMYLDMNENCKEDDLESNLLKVLSLRNENREYTRGEQKLLDIYNDLSNDYINDKLNSFHNYKFIGRVGLFTPILSGNNAGLLVRQAKTKTGEIKYDSVVGTKGYRWLESEEVRGTSLEQFIDESYYIKLVDDAKETIGQYGDYEWFVSSEDYIGDTDRELNLFKIFYEKENN